MKQSHAIGIDEVGRGPWAGPLVAVAVRAEPLGFDTTVRDSKRLSERQRQSACLHIRQRARAIGIGWASAAYIDRYGLSQATAHAMESALVQVAPEGANDTVYLDGNYNYLPSRANVEIVPGGDALVPVISAASVVAKVMRDGYMRYMDQRYPVYGFARHVGYGTAVHRHALERHGPSVLHRRSFRPVAALAEEWE